MSHKPPASPPLADGPQPAAQRGEAATMVPDYPRIADMLDRLRAQDRSRGPIDAPLHRELAAAMVADAVAPDLGRPASRPLDFEARVVEVVAPSTADRPLPPMMETLVHPAAHAATPAQLPPHRSTSTERVVVAPHQSSSTELVPTVPALASNPPVPDIEVSALVNGLLVRDVAREALRARMIAFGEGRHHRSAYELVFVMLAFAVMVLIAAPPLVDVLLALHGTKP